jgi:hypothetical protein
VRRTQGHELIALPQHRRNRRGFAHRLRELVDQFGERFIEGHARWLPLGSANRFGDLQQAKRRRFSLIGGQR